MTKTLKPHCPEWEDAITDALFGDATAADAQRLQNHLAECQGCATEYQALADTLVAASSRETESRITDQRLNAFQERVLMQTVHASPGLARRSPQVGREARGMRLLEWPAKAAAVAAVLIVGVLIGRGLPNGNVAAPSVLEAQLISATEQRAFDYLDQSKTLLLGVANFSGSAEDVSDLNLPRRSEIAQGLLVEANYLKSNLSDAQQQRLKALVAELEVILLQLAHLDAEADIPALEIMQAGVDNTGLLFKIDVEKMRREGPVTRPQRPGTST